MVENCCREVSREESLSNGKDRRVAEKCCRDVVEKCWRRVVAGVGGVLERRVLEMCGREVLEKSSICKRGVGEECRIEMPETSVVQECCRTVLYRSVGDVGEGCCREVFVLDKIDCTVQRCWKSVVQTCCKDVPDKCWGEVLEKEVCRDVLDKKQFCRGVLEKSVVEKCCRELLQRTVL